MEVWVALTRDISGPGAAEWIRATPLTLTWQSRRLTLLSLLHPRVSLSSGQVGAAVWGRKQEADSQSQYHPLNSCTILISQVTSLDPHVLISKIRCSEILFIHLLIQQICIKQLFYARSWIRKRPCPCPWIIVSNLLTCIINFLCLYMWLTSPTRWECPWSYIFLILVSSTGPNTMPGTYCALNIKAMNMLHY